ncbi:MAG TPA: zf-TFIIB domain-containing protein [Planctomycetota bacterium]|nr:zf-TFIIB domain-containing protein [Planctomycetota bacterium]
MRVLAACKACSTQFDVSGFKPGESVHCACGGRVIVPQPRVQDARLVRCSSCGGSRGDGTNCEFCGARFSSIDRGWGTICPGCFCRLPNDAAFCVECGININPQKLNISASELSCPRCSQPLQQRMLESIRLFECAGCAGMWLPAETFDAICKSKESRSAAGRLGGRGATGRLRFELRPAEKVKYIPCPGCKNLMNRRNFAGISGVIIDTCKNCGVWLDDKEFSHILKFIENGGLEQARDVEARNRAHAEKMRPKSIASLHQLSDVPAANPEIRLEIVLPGLARAVSELARAFKKM